MVGPDIQTVHDNYQSNFPSGDGWYEVERTIGF